MSLKVYGPTKEGGIPVATALDGWKHASTRYHNHVELGRIRMAYRKQRRELKRLATRATRRTSKRVLQREAAEL